MGKKKLLKEIESLKSKNSSLIGRIDEINNNNFKNDFDLVKSVLERHGNLDYTIEMERNCVLDRVRTIYKLELTTGN